MINRFMLFLLSALMFSPAMAYADRGIEVRGKLAAQAGVKVGEYRALIIGINDYEDGNIPDLQTAVGDASAVANLLRTSYGFKDVTLLLNRQADNSSVIRAMRKLANSS